MSAFAWMVERVSRSLINKRLLRDFLEHELEPHQVCVWTVEILETESGLAADDVGALERHTCCVSSPLLSLSPRSLYAVSQSSCVALS